MVTVIWTKLDENFVKQLGADGVKVREMHEDNVFIADYSHTSDPIIHNKPLTGFINEKTQIVNEKYSPVVAGIKNNYKDLLGFINERRILFLEDIAWEMTDKTTQNSKWKIKLQRAPKAIQDMFGVDYIIKTRKWHSDRMSEAQEAAMIMSELLRIDSEKGTIKNLTTESYSYFTSTFGEGWLEKDAQPYPNVAEEKVELVGIPKLANGQLTFATFKPVEIRTDENQVPFEEEPRDIDELEEA